MDITPKKQIIFCSREKEFELINKIYYQMLQDRISYRYKNLIFFSVSPDFSGSVSTILTHYFTHDGYCPQLDTIIVPDPGKPKQMYIDRFVNQLQYAQMTLNYNCQYIPVLLEAGILSGQNYTWITNTLLDKGFTKPITVTLYENIHSVYKSDYVGEYFDYEKEDLVFYYERPDRAFGDFQNK